MPYENNANTQCAPRMEDIIREHNERVERASAIASRLAEIEAKMAPCPVLIIGGDVVFMRHDIMMHMM